MRVKCDEVRPLLPELADVGLRSAGPAEEHLAGCTRCSAELGRYRALIHELSALRGSLEEPPEGFLARLLAQLPEPERASLLRRAAADERLQYAALSLGGVVVGAAAIGLLWWRSARKTLAQPPANQAVI
jgi:anti-sigma factor RsiW